MTSGVMAQLDRDRFEVVLIHHVSSTSRLKSVPELSETTQISYTLDPEFSVRKIRELRCDLLLESGGGSLEFFPSDVSFGSDTVYVLGDSWYQWNAADRLVLVMG